ncbi:YggS family pyridoxal phosphate-dependent enzyme [Burkholderia sp. THE68]|uniref:YggS family pyridoxal phosphate-dependent enzyme n=1 Tax=Burkholderia sp. THE68 TaxID=758782 RepID=UPI00138A222C|nr:YggS family pyridoxal phosphate-dependent enzyme [Burkholderia sp. THE68]
MDRADIESSSSVGNNYPGATTSSEIAANLESVRVRIAQACERSGRDPGSVRLLPVTKTIDDQRIRMAYGVGCRSFGENKVQEAAKKAAALKDLPDAAWAVIGHLQSNKAKVVAKFASEFQALDSLKLAEALDRRLEIEARPLSVLIQVNTSDEPSKYGLNPADVPTFAKALSKYSWLRVRGLMTLAVLSEDRDRVRACFRCLKGVQERLKDGSFGGAAFDDLSMGMSGDFEIAVEEGATTVRVGQAIFGARALPDSYYWPSQRSQ